METGEGQGSIRRGPHTFPHAHSPAEAIPVFPAICTESAELPFRAAGAEPMIAPLGSHRANGDERRTRFRGRFDDAGAGPERSLARDPARTAASVPEYTYRLWFSPLSPCLPAWSDPLPDRPAACLALGRPPLPGVAPCRHRRAVDGIREVELVVPDIAPPGSAAHDEAACRVTLNPAYTFERFVIGPGNRLAHAAALAVAEAPGEAYNPLFLHGPPGLGKTHLLGAIANYLHDHSPELAVHYTTAESFTNEFVSCSAQRRASRPSRSATGAPTCC